jgi:beta-phosphoglucomutase
MNHIKILPKSIKTIIFDMDGVLVDLESMNYAAYKRTLKDILKITLTHKQYQQFFAGTKTEFGFEQITLLYKTPANIPELVQYYRKIKKKYLSEQLSTYVSLRKNTPQLLETLKLDGYVLAVATSTVREFTMLILKGFDIQKYFDYIICAEDVHHGKPDPEIYTLALQKSKTSPENALVIEDSLNGIHAAQKAHILVIGIANNGKNKEDIKKTDLSVHNWKELLEIIHFKK